MIRHRSAFVLSLLTGFTLIATTNVFAGPPTSDNGNASIAAEAAISETTSAPVTLAQVQPAPPTAPSAAQTPSAAQAPAAPQDIDTDPIGNVATLTGNASVIRNNTTMPLRLQDDIYLNDTVQTSVNSTVSVTFNDATTFNLTANARLTIDNYIYEDGSKKNAATFNAIKGTIAFAAAAVAKTGDMKISTPTATLGIRGTTGLVEVPQGPAAAGANPSNVAIKLYPDADGRVGHIDVTGRDGTRLGSLTQGASGFTIQRGAGGRFSASPLAISPVQAQRDQGIVRQVHAAQSVGRQIVSQKRAQRAANPNRSNQRNTPARQPGLQKQGVQQGAPGAQRPAASRPAQRRAAPKAKPAKKR